MSEIIATFLNARYNGYIIEEPYDTFEWITAGDFRGSNPKIRPMPTGLPSNDNEYLVLSHIPSVEVPSTFTLISSGNIYVVAFKNGQPSPFISGRLLGRELSRGENEFDIGSLKGLPGIDPIDGRAGTLEIGDRAHIYGRNAFGGVGTYYGNFIISKGARFTL